MLKLACNYRSLACIHMFNCIFIRLKSSFSFHLRCYHRLVKLQKQNTERMKFFFFLFASSLQLNIADIVVKRQTALCVCRALLYTNIYSTVTFILTFNMITFIVQTHIFPHTLLVNNTTSSTVTTMEPRNEEEIAGVKMQSEENERNKLK